MLVLSRRKGEQLVLQLGKREVWLRILEVGSNHVRVGIDAPKQVAVYRDEIWKQRLEVQDEPQSLPSPLTTSTSGNATPTNRVGSTSPGIGT